MVANEVDIKQRSVPDQLRYMANHVKDSPNAVIILLRNLAIELEDLDTIIAKVRDETS